ncbi:MAG TPA: DUF2167 domain-containing protein [Steroidobacteraceae bacterium]|nr:DUF2167 domain-containing protein [Steroidobacteraceae bacterium]
MRLINSTAAWLLCAAFAIPAWAQEPANEPQSAAVEEPAAGAEEQAGPAYEFKYQTGDILLPNKVATLHLGEKYRYMSPEEGNKLLQLWGNLPDETLLGVVVPAEVDPMSDSRWAVFLNYKDEGHIDDSDANEIDYDDLLKDMQKDEKAANEQRKAAGYDTLSLVGWAEPPRYDASAKKLYWAKNISSGSGGHSLNYDVRVLGREGVLEMEAVAPLSQLAQVKRDMEPLIGVAEFNKGYRYAEFDKSTDRMAEYGLGALVAGTIAAKTGLLAKLLGVLVGLWKFIAIGLVAVGSFIARLFGKKKEEAA